MTDALTVSVRIAEPTDLEVIAGLYEAGRGAAAGQRGGEIDNLLTIAEPTTEGLVVVGEVDSVPLGYARAERVALPDGTDLMRVVELFVDPAARGVGVGRAMMDALVERAEAIGCRGIDARALPGDRTTKNFFESFGLVARSIIVHRDLRPAPVPD